MASVALTSGLRRVLKTFRKTRRAKAIAIGQAIPPIIQLRSKRAAVYRKDILKFLGEIEADVKKNGKRYSRGEITADQFHRSIITDLALVESIVPTPPD